MKRKAIKIIGIGVFVFMVITVFSSSVVSQSDGNGSCVTPHIDCVDSIYGCYFRSIETGHFMWMDPHGNIYDLTLNPPIPHFDDGIGDSGSGSGSSGGGSGGHGEGEGDDDDDDDGYFQGIQQQHSGIFRIGPSTPWFTLQYEYKVSYIEGIDK